MWIFVLFYSDHLSSDLIFIKVRSIVYAVRHMAERKRKNDGGGEKLLRKSKSKRHKSKRRPSISLWAKALEGKLTNPSWLMSKPTKDQNSQCQLSMTALPNLLLTCLLWAFLFSHLATSAQNSNYFSRLKSTLAGSESMEPN